MARKLFLVDLDLNGNKLKNVALEALASAPETFLSAGRAYYDSEAGAVKVYDGSAWQTMLKVSDVAQAVTAGSSAPVSSGAVASAIAGLSGAMHFIAVLDSTTYDTFAGALAAYKAAHTSYAEAAGDVMVYGIKEYVYDGSQWCELGDETMVVMSFGGATGAITVRGSQSATGKVNLSMSGNELQAELVMPIASDILMTGYVKAQAEAAVAGTDTVAEAIGKVEFKVDYLKEAVLENEETTAQALNDLNTRINAIVVPGKYVGSITSDDGTHAVTIAASTHECGTDPVTCVYYDGSQVIIDQSIDASGNVTLSWAAGTTVSAEHPLKVVIMG
jgi:hypothetical protein